MFKSLFQTFVETADPSQGASRLKALRAALERPRLDGFLVPRADAHQNEYVAPCEERLAWLTGFTGSAGFAIVLRDKAALFVDGRYTAQAREQVDANVFTPIALAETAPSEWLAQQLKHGARIGYDPSLHTTAQISRFSAAIEKTGAALVAVAENPIDALWTDRPPPPLGRNLAASAQICRRARGEEARKNRRRPARPISCSSATRMRSPGLSTCAAQMSRIRRSHWASPLFRAKDKPQLFIDPRKLSQKISRSLGELAELCAARRPARTARPSSGRKQIRPAI